MNLEKLTELMFAIQKYTPIYVKELDITHGDYYKLISCLDPNHEDKNPSCSWWPEARVYHCFSCSESFNIFKIASLYENKPKYGKAFILENVFYLAKKFGVPYEHINVQFTPEDAERFKQYEALGILAEHILKNKNKEYLEKRKINEKTAAELKIGSVDWDLLSKEYSEAGYDQEYLEKLGIKKTNLNSNKLVLIIKDSYGRPVSFVSREMFYDKNLLEKKFNFKIDKKRISEESKEGKTDYLEELCQITQLKQYELERYLNCPKYVNGKASLIYNKSKIFFGYSDVKEKINFFQNVLIIEG